MTASPFAPHPTLDRTAPVTVRPVGRRTVLRVAGEIDMATAPHLRAAIDAALSDGALELWIDLSATGFMDSSGVHALMAAQARVHELQRRLAIICPGGRVRRVFDIAGVSSRLPIFDDRAAAHLAS